MEIWNWVEKLQDDLGEAGQPQNAQLLTRLTDHICDLQIERAEALLPRRVRWARRWPIRGWRCSSGIGKCATGSAICAKASVR